jgi:hypothetical protein
LSDRPGDRFADPAGEIVPGETQGMTAAGWANGPAFETQPPQRRRQRLFEARQRSRVEVERGVAAAARAVASA